LFLILSEQTGTFPVKFLVENGADIEIANRHGHTALMIASYREKANVVRYLLSVGAQINRTSVKG
jgi:ankyrin repeat protein